MCARIFHNTTDREVIRVKALQTSNTNTARVKVAVVEMYPDDELYLVDEHIQYQGSEALALIITYTWKDGEAKATLPWLSIPDHVDRSTHAALIGNAAARRLLRELQIDAGNSDDRHVIDIALKLLDEEEAKRQLR